MAIIQLDLIILRLRLCVGPIALYILPPTPNFAIWLPYYVSYYNTTNKVKSRN